MSYNVISKSKYKSLRNKYDSHHKAFESYRAKTGKNFTDPQIEKTYNIPKGTTNEETSQMEVYQYKDKPLKVGDKYFAYLSSDGQSITTFTDDKLADILSINETKHSSSYLSDKKYSFVAKDINGNKIKGIAYAGKGGYVRFHRSKDFEGKK